MNNLTLHHLGRRLAYEQWKDIDEYAGSYQVSNLGRVRSIDRMITKSGNVQFFKKGKILSQINSHGYKRVSLKSKNNGKLVMVHRLVAIAFLGNPNNKPQVNHKDGIKDNNQLSNLEWVTASENQKHSFDELGRVSQNKGRFGKNSVAAKSIRCVQTGIVYPSVIDASKDLGIHKTSISKVLSKRNAVNKTAGGLVFEYFNPPAHGSAQKK